MNIKLIDKKDIFNRYNKDSSHDIKNVNKDSSHDIKNVNKDSSHDIKNVNKDSSHDIKNDKYRGFPGNEEYNLQRRQKYQENKQYIREQIKEARYLRRDAIPMDINKDCTASLGVDIGEYKISKILLENIFDHIGKMDYRNHGYDFICKNPRQDFVDKYPQFELEIFKEYKIDIKTRCLSQRGKTTWNFDIDSDMPDYFMFNLIDNRDDLNLLYSLLIQKNQIINGRELWDRDYLYITNKPKSLLQYKKFNLVDKIYMNNVYKNLEDEKFDI